MTPVYLLLLTAFLYLLYSLQALNAAVLSNPVITFGLMAMGAALSSASAKRFRLSLPDYRFNLGQGFTGGLLMGIGFSIAGLPELGNNLTMVNGIYYWLSFVMPQGFVYLTGVLLGGGAAVCLQRMLYPRLVFKPWTQKENHLWKFKVVLAVMGVLVLFGGVLVPGQAMTALPAILAALAGGFLLERNRICMALLMKELYLARSAHTLLKLGAAAILLALAWQVSHIGGPAGEQLGWGALPGALIMGFGFMLAEGCFMGSIWKAGQGNLTSFAAILGIFAGGAVTRLRLTPAEHLPGQGWLALGVKLGFAFLVMIWVGAYIIERPGKFEKSGPKGIWLLSEASLLCLLPIFVFAPRFKLPVGINVLGLVLFYAAAALYAWARLSLGSNWGEGIGLRVNHRLVTTGPYGLMRHPVYTAVILGFSGLSLVLGSLWGSLWIWLMVLPLLVLRAREEEKLLTEIPGAEEYFRRIPVGKPK